MKIAAGLIWIGLAGGTLPAGIGGLPHLGGVILGAAAATGLLLGACLVPAVLETARSVAGRPARSRGSLPTVAPRRP